MSARTKRWKFRRTGPLPGTGDFWYDLVEGNYIKPEDVLVSSADAKQVSDAITTLRSLQYEMQDANLLPEE